MNYSTRLRTGTVLLLHLLALTLFGALALERTFPLLDDFSRSLVGGPHDPVHILSVMTWNYRSIFESAGALWNPPYFYPHAFAHAYSEPFLLPSLLAAPAIALTGSYIVGYNLIYVSSFALNCYAMFLLCYVTMRSWWAAVAAGLAFGFSTFFIAHFAQIPYLVAYWMPLAIGCLYSYLRRPRFSAAAGFSACLLAQYLSCLTFGLFLTVIAICVVLIQIRDVLPLVYRGRFWRDFFTLGILCGVTLWAYLEPFLFLSRQMGLARDLGGVQYFSASLRDYALVWDSNLVYHGYLNPQNSSGTAGAWLFPGLAVCALALRGTLFRSSGRVGRWWRGLPASMLTTFCLLLLSFGHRWAVIPLCVVLMAEWWVRRWLGASEGEDGSRLRRVLSVVLLAGLLLSFGPVFHYQELRLRSFVYEALYYLIPGISGIRNPARFAVLFMIGLSACAALGIKEILNRIGHPLGRVLFGIAAVTVIFVEQYTRPFGGFPLEPTGKIPAVYQWLASRSIPQPLVELPRPHVDIRTLYYAVTYHDHPTVGGYSSYVPPFTDWFFARLKDPLSPESIELLSALGVRLIVLHLKDPLLSPDDRARLEERLSAPQIRWRVLERFPDTQSVVVELDAHPRILDAATGQVRFELQIDRSLPSAVQVVARLKPLISEGVFLSVYPQMNSRFKLDWEAADGTRKMTRIARADPAYYFTRDIGAIVINAVTPSSPGVYCIHISDAATLNPVATQCGIKVGIP